MKYIAEVGSLNFWTSIQRIPLEL